MLLFVEFVVEFLVVFALALIKGQASLILKHLDFDFGGVAAFVHAGSLFLQLELFLDPLEFRLFFL